MITKTNAFRVDGLLFETKEKAEDHERSIKVSNMIREALPKANELTGPFMFEQLSTPQNRNSLRKLIDKVGELMGGDLVIAK